LPRRASSGARSRGRRNDLFDVFDETHVQHAVGFVKDEYLQLRKVDLARVHMVDQATRRGDQDRRVAAEKFHLLRIRHAAEDGNSVHVVHLAAVLLGGGSDLQGEFASRRQHQHAGLCRLEALAFVATRRATALLAHRASDRRTFLRGKRCRAGSMKAAVFRCSRNRSVL
jgi:hypothetical protein